MSADQPPAPVQFSGFIDKETSGKKFKPKARRRPPAAAAAASTVAASQTATPEPPAQPSTATQPVPQDALPTPAPTQEPTQHNDTQSHEPTITPPPASISDAHTSATDPPAVGANTSSATTRNELSRGSPEALETAPAALSEKRSRDEFVVDGDHVTGMDIDELSRSPKRTQLQSEVASSPMGETVEPTLNHTLSDEPAAPTSNDPAMHEARQTSAPEPVEESSVSTQTINANSAPTTQTSQVALNSSPGRTKKVTPWIAVNHPQEEDGEGAESRKARLAKWKSKDIARMRAIAKSKKEKAAKAAQTEAQNEDDGTLQQQRQNAPLRRRITTVVTRRRRGGLSKTSIGNDAAEDDDEEDAFGPVLQRETLRKLPDASRKISRKRRRTPIPGSDEEEEEEDTQVNPPPKKQRKPPAKKKRTANGATAADGEGGQQTSRRRGRRPRSPTPSDAEEQEIEPDATFMEHLAVKYRRIGRVSQREKKMREINWEEVKARRELEDQNYIETFKAQRDKANEALTAAGQERAEAQEVVGGVRTTVDEFGNLVIDQSSRHFDREADADAALDVLQEVVEDDLTNNINIHSFGRNRKRRPDEYIRPGKAQRWSKESTEQFYEALQMWGTDFMLISTMLPGFTRKSIKHKFNSEQRENPELIQQVLSQPRNVDLEEYKQKANKTEQQFSTDYDSFKAEFDAKEKEILALQEQARRARAEREKYAKAHGGALNDKAGKENAKGKRKKKQKETVTFDDSNVEVLGDAQDYDD
ncbi:hypothetical protein EJ04DRAFT_513170 [Polyplosphaeria fusca]|uniref:Myb-like domain-containing protein n=1 Tax=Polyplosphaeria fusca TaxID=682080 RepID=A0A9P4V1X1_9PLEO|nr:hypothetical protein EJ04DRAFT_513170 [Polyplosphaeria fusca]